MIRPIRFLGLSSALPGAALSLATVVLCAAVAGCGPRSPSPGSNSGSLRAGHYEKELFVFAIDNLNRLEEYNSPEMQRQVIDRLNQWGRSQPADPSWKADPLLATLPAPLAKLPDVTGLGEMRFPATDALALQEIVWLRDVARRVRGTKRDPLNQAIAIFDWTVRNVQLDPLPTDAQGQPLPQVPQSVGETLLFGRGTPMDRAWLFLLLARQQGLDAAMLAVRDPAAPNVPPQPWVPAVLVDGEIYLFEVFLGIPIPQIGGVTADRQGQLQFRPVSLAEAVGDDFVFRQLDLNAEDTYPIASSVLKGNVVALVEASPLYLSRRMKVLESRLTGDQRMVLATDASAQAQRWKDHPQVADAQLWTMPFETIVQLSSTDKAVVRERVLRALPLTTEDLAKGRILHLKGQFEGEENALARYQSARPSQRYLEAGSLDDQMKMILNLVKQDASYWLGLVAFERGQYSTAVDYFDQRTLQAFPEGIWVAGANYNLARTYEAMGEFDKAMATYRRDATSPLHRGNFLRARFLEGLHSKQAESPEAPKTPEPPAAEPKPAEEAPAEPKPAEETPATPPALEPLPGLPPL